MKVDRVPSVTVGTLTMVVDVVRPRRAVSTNARLELDVDSAFAYGLSFDGFAVVVSAEDMASTANALDMVGLVIIVRVVARPMCRRLVLSCGCDVRGYVALRIATKPLSPSMFVHSVSRSIGHSLLEIQAKTN